MRHLPVLGAGFGPVTSVTIDGHSPMLLADQAELVTTRSYYLSASPTERNQVDADVVTFLRAQFSAVESVELPYRTHCFRAWLV